MKVLLITVGITALFFGCVSKQKSVPVPSAQTDGVQSRQVASTQAKYEAAEYFVDGNFFVKFKKLNSVAKQLLATMPDKGSAKKRLVRQFIRDLDRIEAVFAKDKSAISDNSNSWLPPQTSTFAANVKLLGQAVQSSNMMDRMGIYLSASGVMESDTMGEDFYYTMLAQAIGLFDNNLRGLMLVYLPEQRDTDENTARLGYAKALAAEIRSNLKHAFQSNKSLNVKVIEKLLSAVGASKTLQQAAGLKTGADYKYTQDAMKGLHIMNSSDIDGFKDEVELTLSTKFSFEMINELISSVR